MGDSGRNDTIDNIPGSSSGSGRNDLDLNNASSSSGPAAKVTEEGEKQVAGDQDVVVSDSTTGATTGAGGTKTKTIAGVSGAVSATSSVSRLETISESKPVEESKTPNSKEPVPAVNDDSSAGTGSLEFEAPSFSGFSPGGEKGEKRTKVEFVEKVELVELQISAHERESKFDVELVEKELNQISAHERESKFDVELVEKELNQISAHERESKFDSVSGSPRVVELYLEQEEDDIKVSADQLKPGPSVSGDG